MCKCRQLNFTVSFRLVLVSLEATLDKTNGRWNRKGNPVLGGCEVL